MITNSLKYLTAAFKVGRPRKSDTASTNQLIWWRKSSATENFGDKLSEVIVKAMLHRGGFFIDDQVHSPRRLLAVGSILHLAKDSDVIWGSGINGKVDANYSSISLDIRAVRGPLTRRRLVNDGHTVPETFGDPATLLEKLLPHDLSPTDSHKYSVSVLPNLNDDFNNFRNLPGVNFISPLLPWRQVRNEIRNSDTLITSSLHGIIVGETCGTSIIPQTPEKETLFKYEDYFEGTGRQLPKFNASIRESLRSSPIDKISLETVQIMESFPYDLWSENLCL